MADHAWSLSTGCFVHCYDLPMVRLIGLALEFFVTFFVLPAYVVLLKLEGRLHPRMLLPLMWLLMIWCLLTLHRHGGVGWRQIFKLPGRHGHMKTIVLRWLAFAPLIGLYVWWTHPADLFFLPRRIPQVWVIVMCAYPIVSVIPQGIIWRRFVLQRYEPLFGSGPLMLLMAATAFCFVHLIFLNVEALIVTFVGGLLFTHTYMKTRSLMTAAIEHAMYGGWAFTCGFGRFLYGGTVPLPSSLPLH